MDEGDEGGLSIRPSIDRSFDGWVPPVSLASIARRASSTKPAVRDASIDSARARAPARPRSRLD